MTTKSEQGQYIVQEYRRAGNKWPATMREVAAWAVEARLWAPQPSAVVSQCAEELSRALRDEYVTDPQGRRIRTKHAATYTEGNEQFVLWDDIRTAPPAHMQRAFQQRRHQILGDCKQLKSDVDSFNQNRQPPQPIQIVFDFTLDLEEAKYLKRSA
ncbi:hypothetical protein AB4Z34_35870 [Ensifer sp. 2YAB10]|uniref:hypothetical protein n=1 Tax=Ensifer sp. 2YAB10 TaxID=3233021 RepID=UPI003F9084CA